MRQTRALRQSVGPMRTKPITGLDRDRRPHTELSFFIGSVTVSFFVRTRLASETVGKAKVSRSDAAAAEALCHYSTGGGVSADRTR
jgi:hypothetical protein